MFNNQSTKHCNFTQTYFKMASICPDYPNKILQQPSAGKRSRGDVGLYPTQMLSGHRHWRLGIDPSRVWTTNTHLDSEVECNAAQKMLRRTEQSTPTGNLTSKKDRGWPCCKTSPREMKRKRSLCCSVESLTLPRNPYICMTYKPKYIHIYRVFLKHFDELRERIP